MSFDRDLSQIMANQHIEIHNSNEEPDQLFNYQYLKGPYNLYKNKAIKEAVKVKQEISDSKRTCSIWSIQQ